MLLQELVRRYLQAVLKSEPLEKTAQTVSVALPA
jgi:hypothetical protein